MKIFDWIIFIIFIPWFLLFFFGRAQASSDFRVKAGLAEPKVKVWQVWFLFGVLILECYKVRG